MAKSKYSEKFIGGLQLLEKLRDGEIGRLQRASEEDRIPILEAWEDLAGSERLVKENHEGRYLFELMQNANDALAEADLSGLSRTDHCVRIELSNESLIVANLGQPFGEENVRALRRLHKTTKRMGILKDETGALSHSKRIGHKGIGFKSVLDISIRPEVYSDIYAFVFDGEKFYRDVDNIINNSDKWTLPTFRVPYPIYINQHPQKVRDKIDQLFDAGFVTVIRLPLDNPSRVDEITMRIEQDIQPELLLFMSAISRIELSFPDGKEIAYVRKIGSVGGTGLEMVSIEEHNNEGMRLVSRWLTLQAIRKIEDRSLLLGLGDAWKDVEALGFTIAFPLLKNALGNESDIKKGTCWPAEPFHVYYPTDECSGLSFKVHGDFYVGDNRKTIPPDKPINKWLINEICDYLSGDGLDCLKRQWPYEAELVYRLIPIDRPEGAFAHAFMDTYLEVLRITPFVPISGQNYKPPEEIRLPPREVDQQKFCRLFPPSRIRGSDKWAYPIDEVVEREISRTEYIRRNPHAIQFLQRRELGCNSITIDEVVAALGKEGMPSLDKANELISVLGDWRAELPGTERVFFVEKLGTLQIFPTVNGWCKPGEELVFQANLREDIEETLPEGFAVSVLRRSVYPAGRGATASNQYKLFDELGAREYSRRSLIVEAILPILTDEELFANLQNKYPNAIYQAYILLKEYFIDDGTITGFGHRLKQVPVPTIPNNVWRPANDCFFGIDWPLQNGEILQRIYEGFDDSYFLADIPQLSLEEADNRNIWATFFKWLGVADRPRVITSNQRVIRKSAPPSSDLTLWYQYMEAYDQDFKCPNIAAYHGFSRGLESVSSINHFADLVEEQNNQKLLDLFVLLASYWEDYYKNYSRTTMACDRVTCAHNQVDNYLLYELQNSPWVPVKVSSKWKPPLSPKQIWTLGETDPVDARALVPTLPEELRQPEFNEFVNALGFVTSSSAGIEDYVRLLELMPETYPVEIQELSENENRRWQRSLSAVFNWICERLQTGLVSRGDNPPQCPSKLKVLAFRGDRPVYVELDSPELVYPDDTFIAERWSEHCVYLRINDDWRTLLNWLEIPNLSNIVRSNWQIGGVLEQETKKLRKAFYDTLPFYLALIKHTQPANYERLVPRLHRLNLNVVKDLQVKEWLEPLPRVDPLLSSAQVHLEKRDEPNPGVGRRFVIAGDLYVAKDSADNLDLLGEYLADYIEIARLGDAFVILINRPTDPAKWRFLNSKGVTEDILAVVVEDIRSRSDSGEEIGIASLTIEEILERITSPGKSPKIAPTPVRTTGSTDGGDNFETDSDGAGTDSNSHDTPLEPLTPKYPDLSFDNLPGVIVEDTDSIDTHKFKKGRKGGGGRAGTGTAFVPRQIITEELGKRGESWAYENEKIRLQNDYGMEPAELEERNELFWISRQKPTANYDIKSIRITNSGEIKPIFIEVKSSTGDDRRIKMSRGEFHLAMNLGDDYWLYWVANVDEAKPDPPVCYKNVAQLVVEEKIILDVDTLDITLPTSHSRGETIETTDDIS